jgi:hypothetical protein
LISSGACEATSGHGSRSRLLNQKNSFIYGPAAGERGSRTEHSPDSQGRGKRPREKQTKTDAQMYGGKGDF